MTRPVLPVGSSAGARWISRAEASRALGISATTLRRWSDAGMVRVFVTPGGHRRFDAASIQALLPGSKDRPTTERLGETPERMARAYRRAGDRKTISWVGSLDEAQRDAFRAHGRVIAAELLAALDAVTQRDRASHLATACETAAHYGVAAAGQGLPVSATAEAFLRFRRPFLDELAAGARRRGLDTAAATDLLARASDAIDGLLVSTLGAHEATVLGLDEGRVRPVPTGTARRILRTPEPPSP